MIFLIPNQDLSAASGILNIAYLESIYESFMDEALLTLGQTITIHLPPQKEADTQTQLSPQAQQYNPFFGRVVKPNNTTRNSGFKVTPIDVNYLAQVSVGPRSGKDLHGIGDLKSNEASITVVAEALNDINNALSISIQGRRYSVSTTKPVYFSSFGRKYLIVKLAENQETEHPSPDPKIG